MRSAKKRLSGWHRDSHSSQDGGDCELHRSHSGQLLNCCSNAASESAHSTTFPLSFFLLLLLLLLLSRKREPHRYGKQQSKQACRHCRMKLVFDDDLLEFFLLLHNNSRGEAIIQEGVGVYNSSSPRERKFSLYHKIFPVSENFPFIRAGVSLSGDVRRPPQGRFIVPCIKLFRVLLSASGMFNCPLSTPPSPSNGNFPSPAGVFYCPLFHSFPLCGRGDN